MNQSYFTDIGLWPERPHHPLRVYVVGYILSLALTFGAYYFTAPYASMPVRFTILAIVFALVQCVVQLTCFLHLDLARASRGRLLAFAFATLIIGILIVGTLWIMRNLNDRMMLQTPTEMEQYMNAQQGI